jgi:Uma2 family endonuclease
MNVRTLPSMDKATFFRWLERQERRFELVDGVPRMLPYVTRHHERIATNIVLLLGKVLDLDRFEIAHGDFAIRTGEHSVRFADVMVHPFEEGGRERTARVAPLVVEIASDSTMDVDFGPKLAEYRALDGVGQYVVCAQDKACLWSWQRSEDGSWPDDPEILDDLTQALAVPGLGITLPLAEIYRRVPLAGMPSR